MVQLKKRGGSIAGKWQYLRYLRRVLGDGMRRAESVIAPLKWGLEQNYRFEPEDTVEVMLALDDLGDVTDAVLLSLEAYVADPKIKLTTAERAWLAGPKKKKGQGAIGGLKKAIDIIEAIDPKKLNALQDAWQDKGTEPEKGHEAYLLRHYDGAMYMLRRAWTMMFYAAMKPRPRKIQMTERESSGFYNPLSDVAKSVRQQADAIADEEASYVEVYDADGDLVYVAAPPSSIDAAARRAAAIARRQRSKVRHEWAHKPKKAAQGVHLVDASEEEAEAVLELLASRPGMTLRQAASELGVEVAEYEPVMTANPAAPQSARRFLQPFPDASPELEDFIMLQAVWETAV